MSNITDEFDFGKKIVSQKDLLLFSIPVSILFAITGMDFIGYLIYLGTRGNPTEIYTRSLLNVLLVGFLLTAVILFLIPYLVNRYRWKKPFSYFGTSLGKWKVGIAMIAVALIISPLFYFNSQNQLLIDTYPLTKEVLVAWPIFVIYELIYVLFYYIPYEFFFRGILQLGLSKSWKKWQSILFVTVLTTILHITKPWIELVASFIAGIIFGIIAEKTNSWVYVFFIHSIAGVMTDLFCGLGYLGVL